MALGLVDVPPVSFELSDAEATRMVGAPFKQRRLFLGVYGANIAMNLLLAGLETGIFRLGHAQPGLAWWHLAIAVGFAGGALLFWRGPRPRKQRAWSVSFDEAGMKLASQSGPPRAVPWTKIRSVNDEGAVLVLYYGIWGSAIIPRRAYADNGAALWLLLQRQLIGSRSLRRRPDARIIVNTAAR